MHFSCKLVESKLCFDCMRQFDKQWGYLVFMQPLCLEQLCALIAASQALSSPIFSIMSQRQEMCNLGLHTDNWTVTHQAFQTQSKFPIRLSVFQHKKHLRPPEAIQTLFLLLEEMWQGRFSYFFSIYWTSDFLQQNAVVSLKHQKSFTFMFLRTCLITGKKSLFRNKSNLSVFSTIYL